MLRLTALLILSGTVAHLAQRELDAQPLPTPPSLEETLPSERALDLLALSYRPLVADYYWLKALSQFGDARMTRAGYPNLIALMRRVLHLDPKFASAYHFAGTALTVSELDPGPSIELLEQGRRELPNDWRIAFLLGFNRYYFQQDYLGGAKALAEAAKLEGAPDYTGALALRLTAEANSPEVGLAMLETLAAGTQDEKMKATYEERRVLLTLEVQLKWLNKFTADYAQKLGTPPATLEELVTSGIIKDLPQEPLGGRYFIEGGAVRTTNESRRLRLAEYPKGAKK